MATMPVSATFWMLAAVFPTISILWYNADKIIRGFTLSGAAFLWLNTQKGATMQLKKKTTRQLSVAVGLLSFAAFIVQGLGSTWGFEELAKQIVSTALLFAGGVNVYFLGVTQQKNSAEKEQENAKKTK